MNVRYGLIQRHRQQPQCSLHSSTPNIFCLFLYVDSLSLAIDTLYNEEKIFTTKCTFIHYDPKKERSSVSKLLLQNLKEDLRLALWVTCRFLGPICVDRGIPFMVRSGMSGGWGSSLADEWKERYLCHKYWGCGMDVGRRKGKKKTTKDQSELWFKHLRHNHK